MKSQHDPMKKHKVGTNDNNKQNIAAISISNKIRYPIGVFILNGTLKSEINYNFCVTASNALKRDS